jgi:transcriptional regulator with GAF, ATPase, and Fis domain
MVRIIAVITLSFLGIFIQPFPPGVGDFIFRFLILALIIYLMYGFRPPAGSAKENVQTGFSTDPDEKRRSLEQEVHHDWHLEELLSRDERSMRYLIDQFELIASLAFPDHGWLFLRQSDHTLKTIFYKSYSKEAPLTPRDEFEITGLMHILSEKYATIIENNLNRETQLINFYSGEAYAPNSFLGIPLLIEGEKPLFFVFDALHKENFNVEDQVLFEKIRDNTAIFMLNRLKAYSLLNTLKTKEKLMKLVIELNSSKTIAMAVEKFAQSMAQQFEASRLTISLRKPNAEFAVIRKVLGQKDEFGENTEFPLEEGLTGWVISKKKPYVIEDLEKGEYFIPRYSKKEKTNFGFRSFLGIPIAIQDKVYGAVTLEHSLPNKYTSRMLDDVKEWVYLFSSTFIRQSTEITKPTEN